MDQNSQLCVCRFGYHFYCQHTTAHITGPRYQFGFPMSALRCGLRSGPKEVWSQVDRAKGKTPMWLKAGAGIAQNLILLNAQIFLHLPSSLHIISSIRKFD